VIEGEGVSIESLDGEPVPDHSPRAVAPGRHSLVVSLDDLHRATGGFRERRVSSGPLVICFDVSAGHSYVVRPTYHGWQWQADLFDGPRGQPIATQAGDPATNDCAPVTVELVPAEAQGEGPPPEVPARVHVRIDAFGIDTRYVDPPLTGNGLIFEAGAFLPGDNLGSGFGAAAGVQWTPVWLADVAGFGLSGSVGFKGNSFRVSPEVGVQSRFPMLATIHALVPVALRYALLVRAGIQTDRGVSRRESTDGKVIAAPLTSKLGFVGEVGLYSPSPATLAAP
jgi:hypothetical protein